MQFMIKHLIVLIFFTTICVFIAKNYINPLNLAKSGLDILKKILNLAFKSKDDVNKEEDQGSFASEVLNTAFDKIIDYLKDKILNHISESDVGLKIILNTIMDIFIPMNTDKLDEKINSDLFSNLKISGKFKSILGNTPIGKMIKIGCLLVLALAMFILNFKHRNALNFESYTKDKSNSFQKNRKKYSNLELEYYDSYRDIKNNLRQDQIKEYPELKNDE